MTVDLSRDGYDPRNAWTAVVFQQGRPITDADLDEASDLQQEALRSLGRDLFGPHAVPPGAPPDSFRILDATRADGRIRAVLSPGRYRVDGIALDNHSERALELEDPGQGDVAIVLRAERVLLDAWEEPLMADPALGPGVSQMRSAWRWGLIALPTRHPMAADIALLPAQPRMGAALFARPALQGDIPVAPGYFGVGPMLYRVQVLDAATDAAPAAIAWARDNASAWTPVGDRQLQEDGLLRVPLAGSAGDSHVGLAPGQWVSLEHPGSAAPRALLQVQAVERDALLLRCIGDANAHLQPGRARLRHWHHAGAASDAGGLGVRHAPVPLELGIEVRFDDMENAVTGDAWLVAARPDGGLHGWEPEILRTPQAPLRRQAPLAVLDAAGARCKDTRFLVHVERRPARDG